MTLKILMFLFCFYLALLRSNPWHWKYDQPQGEQYKPHAVYNNTKAQMKFEAISAFCPFIGLDDSAMFF